MTLFWSRYIVIVRPLATAVCLLMLTGCNALQPLFSSKPTTAEAMEIVSTVAETSNLWLPIMFAGFLALLAGIINLVFLRGSAKLLVIGVLLALTPPVADVVLTSIAPWIGVVVAISGLALLAIVFGRWFGRKDIIRRAEARADYIADNGKSTYMTKGQTVDVLNHLGASDFKADYPIKGK